VIWRVIGDISLVIQMFAICSTVHTKSTAATFDLSDVLEIYTRIGRRFVGLAGAPPHKSAKSDDPRHVDAKHHHLPYIEGDKKLGMRRRILESTWR
jgi:hypothetical protein